MIQSLICLFLAIIARITVGTLVEKFEFLTEWLPWLNAIIIVFAVVTVLFIIINLVKQIRK